MPRRPRNRRKATVTKRTNTAPGFNTPDPKFLLYQILGSKTVKNVQIDPQTMEIYSKKLNVLEFESEGMRL